MAAAAPAADDLPDKPYVFEPDEDEPEPEPVKPKKKEKKHADVITYTIPVEPIEPKPTAIPITQKPVVPAPAKAEAKNLDTSGIKIGAKVRHKKFGEGEITGFNDTTMTVRFASGGEKTLSIQITLENGIIEIVKA